MEKESNYKIVRETLKKIYPDLILTAVLILIFVYTSFNLLLTLLVIIVYMAARMIIHKRFVWKSFGKAIINVVIFVVTIRYVYLFLGGVGLLLSTLLISLVLAAIILFRRRKQFFESIRQVETLVFGKSLDKENWKEEKPKWNMTRK